MKIVHLGSLDVRSGGPALSTWLTIKGLRELGHDVLAVCQPLRDGLKLISQEAAPIVTRKAILPKLRYVPKLAACYESVGLADIYHIQGLWALHGWQTARFAIAAKRPYVVTLRGMLYPQALGKNRFVKQLSLYTFQRRVLEHAAAVQCTCVEEADYYRQLGFTNPVAIIPNPIETRGIVDRPLPEKSDFIVGYLGRVHPRKRIERLIYSFARQREVMKDARLRIIGGGDNVYESFLKNEVSRLNLKNVEFTGFLTGESKDKAISSLSCLVVPSDFENFGNIVTEALVRGVPVIASKGTPWQSLEDAHCGFWIDNSQQSIDETIIRVKSMSAEQQRMMAHNGRRFVENNFSVTNLAVKMEQLYRWILNPDSSTPEFMSL